MKLGRNQRGAVVGDADAPAEAPDAPTRRRVLELILQAGPLSVADIAERLQLTTAAIRRHMVGLEEQGLVSSSEQRVYGTRGRGRPSRVFALTDAGRGTFHHAYDDLALAALRQLRETAGPEAIEQLAAQRTAAVEERYHEARATDPALTPVDALAQALNDTGYAATVLPAPQGEQLCLHHCPIPHVAQEFPELCQAETQAFGRLLGSHVQRLATIAHGDGVCTTAIPNPPVAGAQISQRKAHS